MEEEDRDVVLTQAQQNAAAMEIRRVFLKGRSFVQHQLDSFNTFCSMVPSLFEELGAIDVNVENTYVGAKISFTNVVLKKPPIEEFKGEQRLTRRVSFAKQAELQKTTYAGRLYADVSIEVCGCINATRFTTIKEVFLGDIPAMVGSKLCHLDGAGIKEEDPGGYFIVEGVEKALIGQEANNVSRITVSRRKGWKCYVARPTKGLLSPGNIHSLRLKTERTTPDGPEECRFLLYVSRKVKQVPVAILLRALGVASERMLLEVMSQDVADRELCDLIKNAVEHDEAVLYKELGGDVEVRDQETNFQYLAQDLKMEVDEVKRLLNSEFFPDLASPQSKALTLGYMVRSLGLAYLGRVPVHDDNSLKNKRVQGAGELCSHLLRHSLNRLKNNVIKRLQKHLKAGSISETRSFIDSSIITKDFRHIFKSGNWPDARDNNSKTLVGIVGLLERRTPLATLSCLRKINAPTLYAGKDGKARLLTQADYGRICPVETPDNNKLGLLKTMAMFSVITTSRTGHEQEVQHFLDDHIKRLENMEMTSLQQWEKIFLNGRWIGVVQQAEAQELVTVLRSRRREGLLHSEIEIARKRQEIHISSDSGRVLRPLLVLKDGRLSVTRENMYEMRMMTTDEEKLEYLLEAGLVELLGPEEEECCLVAANLENLSKRGSASTSNCHGQTHMELYPAAMLSLSANLIPFATHNQSARVTHQAQKHYKQAVDLVYPQKPLVKTWTMENLERWDLLSGQNCIVAVACYSGFNQEDSIIFNQSSVDRGLFNSIHRRRYGRCIEAKNSSSEQFTKPSISDIGGFSHRLSLAKLDENGLPYIPAHIRNSDIVIGKIFSGEERHKDSSMCAKRFESGRVEQVILSSDERGKTSRLTVVREIRKPVVGDKFSSFHGQKGVVGMLFDQEDLPFNQQGIVPDLVINPHAFPTRETLGQLLECVAGKATAMVGKGREGPIAATPFEDSSPEEVASALHRAGYSRWGKETLCNGFHGKQIKAKLFVGSCFYQRLKQVAQDYMKIRRTGKVNEQTRQPVKDKKAHGGIQFGEMERDCLLAHGAAATLQERLFHLSDPYKMYICRQCKRIAQLGRQRLPFCGFCKENTEDFTIVALPYAVKLLIQELNSMCIDVKLSTEFA